MVSNQHFGVPPYLLESQVKLVNALGQETEFRSWITLAKLTVGAQMKLLGICLSPSLGSLFLWAGPVLQPSLFCWKGSPLQLDAHMILSVSELRKSEIHFVAFSKYLIILPKMSLNSSTWGRNPALGQSLPPEVWDTPKVSLDHLPTAVPRDEAPWLADLPHHLE